MDVENERELLKRFRKARRDELEDLDDNFGRFEDPDDSDILVEKQVKESKRKRVKQ